MFSAVNATPLQLRYTIGWQSHNGGPFWRRSPISAEQTGTAAVPRCCGPSSRAYPCGVYLPRHGRWREHQLGARCRLCVPSSGPRMFEQRCVLPPCEPLPCRLSGVSRSRSGQSCLHWASRHGSCTQLFVGPAAAACGSSRRCMLPQHPRGAPSHLWDCVARMRPLAPRSLGGRSAAPPQPLPAAITGAGDVVARMAATHVRRLCGAGVHIWAAVWCVVGALDFVLHPLTGERVFVADRRPRYLDDRPG